MADCISMFYFKRHVTPLLTHWCLSCTDPSICGLIEDTHGIFMASWERLPRNCPFCTGNPSITCRSRSVSITMTSQWARWRLKSPASRLFTQLFIQAQIKGNIKAPRQWPLWGELYIYEYTPYGVNGSGTFNVIQARPVTVITLYGCTWPATTEHIYTDLNVWSARQWLVINRSIAI